MSPLLSVRNLSIRRDSNRILDAIDWTVQRGENWVILGPNGSGKSSLLNALTGYLPATDDSISLLDHTFGESDWRELRRHIGIVSATIAELLDPQDSALEIVVGGKHAMAGVWGRVTPEERTEARRHLRSVEGAGLADKLWRMLSQGERQRVLIARALMAQPRVLILDEPCSGLDPVARERFLESLDRLAARRSAPGLVLVTHHVEEITPAFTHALILSRGRVVADGPISAALTSATLTAAFESALQFRRRGARFTLSAR